MIADCQAFGKVESSVKKWEATAAAPKSDVFFPPEAERGAIECGLPQSPSNKSDPYLTQTLSLSSRFFLMSLESCLFLRRSHWMLAQQELYCLFVRGGRDGGSELGTTYDEIQYASQL